MKDKIKKTIMPVLSDQTIFHLTQMKSFVDNNLKEAMSKNFKSDQQKIKFLMTALQSISEFVLAQTTENSVRISILKQIKDIEEQDFLGNSQKMPEEKLLNRTGEKLEQDPKELEKENEVNLESTSDS